MEKIGIKAVLEDREYQAGVARYQDSMKSLIKATEDAQRAQEKYGSGSAEAEAAMDSFRQAQDAAGESALALAAREEELTQKAREVEAAHKAVTDGMKMAGAAMAVAGGAALALTKSFVGVASRNQELGIVVAQTGANIGKTTEEMTAYENSIKDMGITTQAARQSLIQMAQANIDLAQATKLARLAQDAAVVGQLNSSDAFNRLITAIQRGEIEMLRTMGLNVSFEESYKDIANQLGKTTAELTQQEKTQARVNAVMASGANIAGAYEAAMGTAGKQQRSMARYTEELADQMGQALLPAYSQLVSAQTDILKSLLDLPGPVKETAAQFLALSGVVLTAGGSLLMLGSKIPDLIGKVKQLNAALKASALLGGVGLGPLAGGLAVAGAATAAILYLNNLNKEREKEAAALIATSKNYEHYVRQVDAANLSSKKLTESLYEQAKAAIEAGQAVEVVEQQYIGLQHALKDIADSYRVGRGVTINPLGDLRKQIASLDDFTLSTLSNREVMIEWRMQMGYNRQEAENFARVVGKMAKEQRTINANTNKDIDYSRGVWHDYTEEVSDGMRRSTDAARALEAAYGSLAEETGLTTAQLQILTTQFGLGEDEIKDWVGTLSNLARALGFTEEDAAALALQMGLTADEIKDVSSATDDLKNALNRASQAFSAFFMEVAGGITSLRDFDNKVTDTTTSYNDKIKKLGQSAGFELNAIREKYENSLPDRTTVADRMRMQEDAWDEWGLRFQDIIENGVASPYLATLEEMGYTKPPDTGVKEWAKELQAALYGGDTTFINESAAAWQAHAASVGEAMASETEAVRAKHAEQKRIADEARAEELAAQEEQRAQMLLEMALGLAEQTNQLQEWAATKGVLESSLNTAPEVLAAIKAGIVEIDEPLQKILTGLGIDLQMALAGTAEQAAANEETILGMGRAMTEGAEAEIARYQELQGELDSLKEKRDAILEGQDFGDMVPQDAIDSVKDINDEIATLEEKLAEGSNLGEGMKFLSEEFTAMADQYLPGITDALDALGEHGSEIAEALGEDFTTAANNILSAWLTNSVIPDLETGLTGLKGTNASVVADMLAKWLNFGTQGLASWKRLSNAVISDLNTIKNKLLGLPTEINIDIKTWDPPPITAEQGIERVIAKLSEIPTQIDVDVDVHTAGAGIFPTEPLGNQPRIGYNQWELGENIIAELARRTKEEWQAAIEQAQEDYKQAQKDLRKALRKQDREAEKAARDAIYDLKKILEQNPWDVSIEYMNSILDAAKKIASIGNFMTKLFKEKWIEPYEDSIEGIDKTISDWERLLGGIDDQLGDVSRQLEAIDEIWAEIFGLPNPSQTTLDGITERLRRALDTIRDIDKVWASAFDLPDPSRSIVDTLANDLKSALDAVREIDKILTGKEPGETDIERSASQLKEFEDVAASIDDILSDPEKFKMLDAEQIAQLEAQRDKALADAEAVRLDLKRQQEEAAAEAQRAAEELAALKEEQERIALEEMQKLAEEERRLREEEARLLEEKKRREEDILRMEQLRIQMQEKMIEQQEKLLALEEQRSRLDFLQQQVNLLELIREHGLDPADVLGGIELGVNASIEDLMEAMSLTLQRLLDQVNEELGIHSPSRIMADVGSQIMAGLAQGIEGGFSLPAEAMQRMISGLSGGSNIPAISRPAMMNQSIQNNNTHSVSAPITANIYNGLDQAMLQAMILQTVHRAMRGW
jgi:hypothetical protein